ncbi:hypothetical protein EHM76_05315 [bacterium]|nr:MAG: hypothetical protein EHM76_05315 [bacterium]
MKDERRKRKEERGEACPIAAFRCMLEQFYRLKTTNYWDNMPTSEKPARFNNDKQLSTFGQTLQSRAALNSCRFDDEGK